MSIRTHLVAACALAAQIVLSPLTFAAEPADGKATAKDISKKAGDTASAIGKYTIQQRDEALKSAKAALDEADARMRSLERKLEREWDQMDQAARKKARAAMSELRKERDEAAEWYGGLKHSSAESWEDVKTGFVTSYERLKASVARAGKAM